MYKFHILIAISIVLLSSCLQEPEKEISIPTNRIDRNIHERYKSISRQVGLGHNTDQSILRLWQEGPFDRIWMTQFITDTAQTTICDFQIFETSIDSTGKLLAQPSLDSVKISCQHFTPMQVADTVLRMGMDTLKSQNEYLIIDSNLIHGFQYSIEISKADYYKFITYRCPGYYSKNSDKSFIRILSYFENHVVGESICLDSNFDH